jgi:site-specific DNA-methyltransferase (adenine-specific)
VDLLVTDPAYESLEKHRADRHHDTAQAQQVVEQRLVRVFPNARFAELFEQIFRVLRRNTHFYLYCDAETMFIVKPEAERVGFRFWKPLVWDKRTIGMGYHYRARYEFILFFEKGKRRLTDLGIADIISVPRIHRGYPAEKPAAVSEILVRQSSQPGEVVADPFMGSGSVGVAAARLGRRFIGTDLNPEAVALSAARLREFGEGREPDQLPSVRQPDLMALMGTRHDRRASTPASSRPTSPAVRRPRPQGLSRGAHRQVDHRQEPLHRRLCRLRARQQGVRDRVQVPGKRRHGGREDSVRPRRLRALPMAGCIAYAGRASRRASSTCCARRRNAAYCLPLPAQSHSTADTRELDHLLAMHFGWWDVLVAGRTPVQSFELFERVSGGVRLQPARGVIALRATRVQLPWSTRLFRRTRWPSRAHRASGCSRRSFLPVSSRRPGL